MFCLALFCTKVLCILDLALSDYFCGLRPVPLMAQLVAPTLESVGERAVVVGLLQDFVITYCAPLLPRTPWGRRHQAAYRTSGHKEDTPHKKTQPHRSKGLTAGWVTIKDSRTRISSDYRNFSQYISKRMMLLKVRKSFLLFVSFLL